MAHWSPPASRSPASRSPIASESFVGSLRGGMATPGGTPTPDLPPLGIWSGLPLISCPECGNAVEEYIPGLGGSITGNPSNCRRSETGVPDGCSFFKSKDEYKAILRGRGLLGPAATPEQGRGYVIPARSGFLIPEPMGNTEMVTAAALEDLKHEMAAQKLAIAQLKTDIEDFKGKLLVEDKAEKATENKLAIAQLNTDIRDFKGKLGVWDKVDKAMKIDSLLHWAKAIVKCFFVANVVVLLFCIVVGMS